MRLRLRFSGGVDVEIEVEDDVGRKLSKAKVFKAKANRWGDEIYFELPVNLGLKGEKVVMEVGEVAYWPEGNSLCIFFGPTPVSKEGEPRAYSPVKSIGRVLGDPEKLTGVRDGESVEVSLST